MTAFPTDITTFQLPGPAGELEVMVEPIPQTNTTIVAILCHPHPLFGGTMTNKVVSTLARTCKDMSIPSVRFNFRGVGKSTGEFDEGRGELDDLFAVIEWVKQVKPQAKIWLAGFSFGSLVAAKAATQGVATQLISIAPPVMRWGFDTISTMPCPWLVVQGDQDEIVPADEVFEWFATAHPEAQVICMHGAGHFFHGQLIALREILIKSLS